MTWKSNQGSYADGRNRLSQYAARRARPGNANVAGGRGVNEAPPEPPVLEVTGVATNCVTNPMESAKSAEVEVTSLATTREVSSPNVSSASKVTEPSEVLGAKFRTSIRRLPWLGS